MNGGADEQDLPGLHRASSKYIDGTYVSAERAKRICESRGLCKMCCEVKTHERQGWGRMKPLTVQEGGTYLVYKGFCISPRCYSLEDAKRALGEDVSVQKQAKKKRRPRSQKAPSSSRSAASNGSSRVSRLEALLEEPPGPSSRRISGSVSGLTSSGSAVASQMGSSGGASGLRDSFSSGDFASSERSGEAISASNSNKRHPSSSREFQNQPSSHGSDRRVLRNPGKTTPLLPDLQLPQRRDDEERVAIEELERLIHEQQYDDFMESLYSNNSNSHVIVEAFRLLRNNVPIAHESMGNVFSSSSWVKYLVDAMESNNQDTSVQVQGVLTLWTLSAVSPRYMRRICKGVGVDEILRVMSKYKTQEEVVETCCGALECITSNTKDGISSSHRAVDKALTLLVETIGNEDNFDGDREAGGTSNTLAIRALYNLALDDDMALSVGNILGTTPLLTVIQQGEDMYRVEWAIQLLWRLVSTNAITFAPFDMIEALLGVFPGFISTSCKDAACGLISCVATVSTDPDAVSIRQTRNVAEAILATAESHPGVANVQLMCIEVMRSICIQPDKLDVVADMDIPDMSVKAMHSREEHADLQGAGCALLSYLCRNEEMLSAVAEVGTEAVVAAVKMHVTKTNPSTSSEGLNLITQGSSAVLISISSNPATAGMLVRSGMISELNSALHNEQAPRMPATTRAIVLNVLAAGEGVDDGLFIVELATQALKGTERVEEAEGILSRIHAMTCSSSSALFSMLGASNGSGMVIILETMETFLQSVVVQTNGCAILANIYVKIKYDGALNQKTQLLLKPQSVEIETHTEREVKALVSAMNKHKTKVKIQAYACTALCNFIVGANAGDVSPEICMPDDVVAAFSGISKNVIDVFSIHQKSAPTLTCACRLFWLIALMNDETEMKLRGSHGISKVCEAMSKFAKDDKLNLAGCGFLSVMLANDNHVEFIGSGDAVLAIFDCICSPDQELVELASELLATTIKTVFTASNEFMEIEDCIEEVILCMNTHSQSAPIQQSMCSFIASLVDLQDNYVKGLIGNNGGLNAIGQAMTIHSDDEMVVECGCRALSSIVSGCKPSVILEHASDLGSILMRSLADHPTNEVVQEAVLGALWGLCAREPSFNDYIIHSNGIPKIIDAMDRHVMVEPVIVSGCSLLWIMASYGENNELIGSEGIRAIVNGMQAHIKSSSVQKEALTALKNLATDRGNKAAIANLGGVAAIVQCMWVHMDSSQIFCAACSALNNVAVDAASKKVTNIENGELTAICFGMNRFEREKNVQMCACFLLKSYCFAPSNVPLIRDEPHLASSLVSAMERFPEDCEQRAYYVLQRI